MNQSRSWRARGLAAVGVSAHWSPPAVVAAVPATSKGRATRRSAAFDAASSSVVNPSDKKGGTLKFANPGDWDSLDPGETYYGVRVEFRTAVRSLAHDVPISAGQGGQSAGTGSRRNPGRAQTSRRGPTNCVEV